jgi:hypothetical protein
MNAAFCIITSSFTLTGLHVIDPTKRTHGMTNQQQQYSTNFEIDFLRIYNKEQDHFLKEDDEELIAAIYGATKWRIF